jgi:hypothetical protein
LRIRFALSTARTWVAFPLRAVATAVVVVATSVTPIAVGSPTPVAQKPNAATLVRGAIEAAQLGAVTVTTLPLRVTVPFQLSVILTLLGSVKTSFQLVDDRVPVFAIVKLRQKPLFQVESFFTVAASVTVPGAGVGVGVGTGVGVGVGAGVGAGVGVGVGAGVGVGVGAGVGVGVGVGAGVGVVPAACVVTTMLFSCPAAEPDTQSPVSA